MRVPPLLPTARRWTGFALLSVSVAGAARAQGTLAPVSRDGAVAAALARGARIGLARADTAVAFARLVGARALPNPVLSASYSKDAPNYHVTAELPLDFLQLRSGRAGAARAARLAAQYRFTFERAAVTLDADTTYTRARAAFDLARLSRRTAAAADSLRRIAMQRRDAGDASDLDVALATVNAGQAANTAAADSLAFLSAVLDLQAVMGLDADRVAVLPADSLGAPPVIDEPDDGTIALAGTPLPVAAARASVESARIAGRLARRSILTAPVLMAGIETGDPSGDASGILPTFGIALPIPFLDRNRGAIAQASAEQARARAELTLAEVESRTAIARVRRERAIAYAKVERDRQLVVSADQVASMALTAYREGASPLPSVLEAQRSAREVLAQYVDDLAAAWIAAAELRVLTLTTSSAP